MCFVHIHFMFAPHLCLVYSTFVCSERRQTSCLAVDIVSLHSSAQQEKSSLTLLSSFFRQFAWSARDAHPLLNGTSFCSFKSTCDTVYKSSGH